MKLERSNKRIWGFFAFAAAYIIVGALVATGYSVYYGAIIGLLFLILIPAGITLALAGRIAYYYVKLHKRFFNPNPLASSYEPDPNIRPQIPKIRSVIQSILITNFGILHLIISIAGFNPQFQLDGTGMALLLLGLLVAIFVSPSLNVASWLLTRSGVLYENRVDGTRINIGKDLRNRLEYAIGPIAAANFIRVLVMSGPNFSFGFGFIITALILSVPSAFVTMLLLRVKELDRLSLHLNERLKKSVV